MPWEFPCMSLVSFVTKICAKLMRGFYFFHTTRLQSEILRTMTYWTNCQGVQLLRYCYTNRMY